jgi:hypothetical protein
MRRFGKASYQMLAKAMQNAHGDQPLSGTAEVMWQCTCAQLGGMLAHDSQYFQFERFIAACKPGADVTALVSTGPNR